MMMVVMMIMIMRMAAITMMTAGQMCEYWWHLRDDDIALVQPTVNSAE